MKIFADVRDFGAAGDGMADDTSAIQQALESGKNIIRIPAGNYRITQTLLVDSFTTIEADADARIYSCGDTPKKEGDFLLSNRDTGNGKRSASGNSVLCYTQHIPRSCIFQR